MKKILFCLLFLCFLLIAAALLLFPDRYIKCCSEGLALWALTVLPSLLPFLFLTLLFCKTQTPQKIATKLSPVCKFLYNAGGESAYVQLMSFLSGYPIGAKLIEELYRLGQIDKNSATKMSVFCSTSGPSFIIGCVGVNMLHDKKAGLILFASHILAAVLNGIIFRKSFNNDAIDRLLIKKTPSENILYECAAEASLSAITVGTLIAVFYVFSQILGDLNVTLPLNNLLFFVLKDKTLSQAATYGLFECTKGCLVASKANSKLALPIIEWLISFGGISVIVQSAAFLSNAKVKISFFILGKILQAFTSFAICYILCLVFI